MLELPDPIRDTPLLKSKKSNTSKGRSITFNNIQGKIISTEHPTVVLFKTTLYCSETGQEVLSSLLGLFGETLDFGTVSSTDNKKDKLVFTKKTKRTKATKPLDGLKLLD